jgi:hypothetical protein
MRMRIVGYSSGFGSIIVKFYGKNKVLIKICNFLPKGLHEGLPSYRISLKLLKETMQHFKSIKFLNFFFLVLWVTFGPLKPDPYSQCGAGSSRKKWGSIRIHSCFELCFNAKLVS